MTVDPEKNIIKLLNQIEKKRLQDIQEIKKTLKSMNRRILEIANKIQEFEIILDAAEILEESREAQEERIDEYRKEWNPYDDEDFDIEDYEDYDDENDGY